MNQNNPVTTARFVIPAFALLTLLGLLLAAFIPIGTPALTVDFLDVGQADSILLRSSEGKVVLIDGGYDGNLLLQYLRARNVHHIDLMVLSHSHDDHTGGLGAVLRAIPVDLLVSSGQPFDSPTYEDFQQAVRDSGVKTKEVRAGDMLPFGRLSLQVLMPVEVYENTINNNSVVLRLAAGKVRFLFVGDANIEEEGWMVDMGLPLHADILKVGHHGASTSSSPAFLAQVQPSTAIYFASLGNIHDFPEKQAVDALKASGTKLYGTDVNGTITITTDGSTYTISAAKNPQPIER